MSLVPLSVADSSRELGASECVAELSCELGASECVAESDCELGTSEGGVYM